MSRARLRWPDHEIERIHKEVLDFKHIDAISEPMRELIEDPWPELVHQLRPRVLNQLAHRLGDGIDVFEVENFLVDALDLMIRPSKTRATHSGVASWSLRPILRRM